MNNRLQPLGFWLLATSLLSLAGCKGVATKFAENAAALGLIRESVIGQPFRHVLFRKSGAESKTLHIYLDGDGTPLINGRPTDDPTPDNPLLLRLMMQDPAAAVYLGRPCYHGTVDPLCSAYWWTSGRYSQGVIDSLSVVVKKLLEQGGYETITWIGYSGGGSLAVLLAPGLPQSRVVVTIAANLDTEAWAAYAGGVDLSGSINPVSLPPLPGNIVQKHFVGARDLVVPSALTAKAASYLGGELKIIKDFDHRCCWEKYWPTLLIE